MSLQNEIDYKAKEIQTDSYSMSIGEVMNMYRDGELEIQPDFQRFFRWSNYQKTKFIESILLGIPIPPIFVSQGEGGVWDVIDGLQRLSTIFEFVGILKDENQDYRPPNVLEGTKFLPSLNGKVWRSEDDSKSFTNEQRINFKRAKIDVNIIKKSSDAEAKYELFQRLNTGGSSLAPQEIRNCLAIMINKDFYLWMAELKEYSGFKDCLPLTEKQISEQEDMEILLRFLVYRYINLENIRGNEDITVLLTNKMIEIINDPSFNKEREEEVFKKTFDLLSNTLSENSFKKYSEHKGFYGAFSITAYEAIIIGFSNNIEYLENLTHDQIIDKVKGIYDKEEYAKVNQRGVRAVNRMKELGIFSKGEFRNGE